MIRMIVVLGVAILLSSCASKRDDAILGDVSVYLKKERVYER